MKDLKTDMRRSNSLQKKSTISLAQHEDIIFEYNKSLGQCGIYKLELDDLMRQLKKCTILAPYDCKVIKTIIVPNSGVELGQKIMEIKKL